MKGDIGRTLRRKLEIFTIGITVIFLVVSFAFYSPTARRVSRLKKHVSDLDEKIRLLREDIQIGDEEELKEIKALIDRYDEMKRLYDSSSGPIPSEPDLSGFIDDLIRVGRRAGIEFVRITSGALKEYQYYREVSLEVSVRGSYTELEGFMRGVENMQRLLKISTFQIESDEKRPPVITADFLIRCCIRSEAYEG